MVRFDGQLTHALQALEVLLQDCRLEPKRYHLRLHIRVLQRCNLSVSAKDA